MTSRPTALKSALQFCGSCCVTVGCWALWLVLTASLCCLVYVACARELPVPSFVLRRVEAGFAQADLAITFGSAVFDPTGRILLRDVRLRTAQFEEPLVTSRLVYVRRSIWSVLAGRPVPDEIQLEGAAVQLPAMISPTGTVEPLLRDLTIMLRHDDNVWHVDQFAGRVGQLALTAAGDLRVPPRPAGAAPLSPAEITRRFLQASRRAALEIHRFDAFEKPTLDVRLELLAGVGNTATIVFTAAGADQPWGQPLVLGSLVAVTGVRLEGKATRPVRVHAAVAHAGYRGLVEVDHVRAILSAQLEPEAGLVHPLEALVAVGQLTAQGETALGPVLRTQLANWPQVGASVETQLGGEFLAAEVEAELARHTARIRGTGRVAPELISAVLEKHTPRAAPYFVFGDPVAFTAEAELGPGWHFERLAGVVDAGRLDSHGVKITAARGRIDIAGTSFLAHDARVELADNFATGSYWMDFKTTDYQMLLTGRLRPLEIDGWFKTDWWRNFWSHNFDFPGGPADADVEVSGRWKDHLRTLYFGRADAHGARVLGGEFDAVHTRIFVRPQVVDALEITGTRDAGRQRLAGHFRRFADPFAHKAERVDFAFDANLNRDTYRAMSGGKIDALLDSLKFTTPPQVHVAGALLGAWPGPTPDYTFHGSATGGLEYYGFPLDAVEVDGTVKATEVRLDRISFAAAGGTGSGKATLSGPTEARRLGFDLSVNGAGLAASIRSVEQYTARRTGQKAASMTESKFMQRAAGGKLDVALSAEGVPGELASFKGNGNASLKGAELGEIHLFGLLSQVLSGLSLNFSSLKLDAATTSFKMDQGKLHFPDLKVTGSGAVIDARGDYTFANNGLDFTARLKPFLESSNPLKVAVGIVVSPIVSILELKLTGQVSKPNWSLVVGPSSTPPAEKAEPTPPPATPPAAPLAPPKT
ncbi:MAG TPA: AsmA-like C-terminal region-containing protein [Lacunisphaera sp.]|nr:AsmA-like C-terminal region-containing protein [Lacunisphaera sp.]